MQLRTLLYLAVLGSIIAAYAVASGPDLVQFQGIALDPAGQPISGPVNLQLGVWDDPTSTDLGNRLFLEDHFTVPAVDGIFSIQIGGGVPASGSFDPETFSQSTRWLEIRINGELLAPRTQFSSVPYALQARHADDADRPSGEVSFFNLAACPPGWSEYTPARGRLLAGVPQGGTLQGSVGTAYGDLEARTHTHSRTSLTGSASASHNHFWATYSSAGRSWSSGDGFGLVDWGDGMDSGGSGFYPLAADDSTPFRNLGTSSSSAFHSHSLGPIGSTNADAPRHQLLVCVKD